MRTTRSTKLGPLCLLLTVSSLAMPWPWTQGTMMTRTNHQAANKMEEEEEDNPHQQAGEAVLPLRT